MMFKVLTIKICDKILQNIARRFDVSRASHSAIGRHLRDAYGNIELLNESQFRMLEKCSTKWDCLVYEMLYNKTQFKHPERLH